MPNIKGGSRGDEYVRLLVQVPVDLTDEQKRLLQEFVQGGEERKQNPKIREFLDKAGRWVNDK